jgi:class 3 adenylate cyclase/tetratricopeptide (TPR) repeat protein
LDCPRCTTGNDPERKFCRECGARLGVACPSCGAVDSAGSKFCGECGSALGVEQPRAGGGRAGGPAEPAEAAEAAAELRLVSVLFADLVGFTSLSEGRDPELVRELLTDYYELAREVVGRYRGSIEKFIGDAVMAVWGAPVAHEDDAERAVRCALDLADGVVALAVRRGLPELAVRAGVQTGEAAVSLRAVGQGLVAGDIVNTAARFQSAAEPGTVVVGAATQRAAGRSIAFRRLDDLTLKGKAEPVSAWQASHLVGPPERGGARVGELEPPFVGRADELRLLRDLYHATAREGRARLVSVMGQAGIGKTRLAWELEKYATGLAESPRWLHGRSPAYQEGLSYWALAEIVRRAAGIAEEEDAHQSQAKLDQLLERELPDAQERSWVASGLGALLGTGRAPEGESGELFAAWRRLLERLAEAAPLVLLFEDIHWADEGMLDFLEGLVQWSRSHPILVLTLARPELVERRPTWGAGQRSFTSLHIDPLSKAEMGQLLEGLVPGLPAEIAGQVVQRAEGIPLYAVETVRMLIDQGALEPAEQGYRLVRPPAQLALPETLHALIAARLDALPAAERNLLQQASVLGQTFQRQALQVIRGSEPGETDRLLDALVSKDLLLADDDPRSPERGQLGFAQGAVREVAYGTLARAERRALHSAAADHFARADESEAVGMVASHYLAAYEAAPDHPAAADLRARARDFLLASAERAHALHSYRQAMAYIEQALPVIDDDAQRAGILERAGEAARAAGDRASAERYLGEAIEWHTAQADGRAAARAAGVLATALVDDVHIEQAIGLASEALERLPAHDGPEAARLLAVVARAHLNRGEDAAALEWAERALVVAEREDQISPLVDALVTRGTALDGVGRFYEGRAVLRGALVLAERHGASVAAMRAMHNIHRLEAGDYPDETAALLQAGIELSERAGEHGWVSGFRLRLLESLVERGEWDEVLAEGEAMDEEALGAHEWEHLNDYLAEVWAMRGEGERASVLLGRWISRPERTVTQHEAAHHLSVARVALAEGRIGDAHREALLASQSDGHLQPGHFLSGRAALWLGDATGLADAIAAFEGKPVRSRALRAQQATLRAGLLALGGDDARTAYEDARAAWRDLGMPLELGLAQLESATFGLSGEEAQRMEAAARQTLGALGADGLVDRLRAARPAGGR